MPEVSKTEIGRRYFKLQKERNVEKAIGKIRRNLGSEWSFYTYDDIEVLKYILGECWVYIHRDEWEKIVFTRLSGNELRELIHIGRQTLGSSIGVQDAVEKGSNILFNSVESF
jgi:hypothetical protein